MNTHFLVYHRLTDDAADRRFHDVAPALWERRLAVLDRLDARPGAGPAPLLELAGGRSVVLTFDDGTADHLAAARTLDRRGWRGIFFIPAGRLGEPGRLSAADVAALAASGHVIGSHGHSHRRFDRLSAEALGDELAASRARLGDISRGAVDWLAPPGGICPAAATAMAVAAGFRHIRGTAWGVAPDGWDARPAAILPAFVMSGRIGDRALRWLLRAGPNGVFDRLARLKDRVKRLAGEQAWDRLREAMGR